MKKFILLFLLIGTVGVYLYMKESANGNNSNYLTSTKETTISPIKKEKKEVEEITKDYYDALIAERYNDAASFISSHKTKETLSRRIQTEMSKANSKIKSYKVNGITPLKNNLYKASVTLTYLRENQHVKSEEILLVEEKNEKNWEIKEDNILENTKLDYKITTDDSSIHIGTIEKQEDTTGHYLAITLLNKNNTQYIKVGDKKAPYAVIRSKPIPVQRLMIPPNQSALILIPLKEKVTPDDLELMEFYRSKAEGVPINKINISISLIGVPPTF
ncbi:hypothetical protein [Brevibacillus laterosporus]|uniref:hypothetical protein n=1 Tax=Brevibacillus laterosporus TaxID=1465 RepID=UPI001EF2DA10|nr:hypothetical protein [Brevibacillus laterosporus]MCG7317812.1 hypothetical protein [Brevibacillus laterosporus]